MHFGRQPGNLFKYLTTAWNGVLLEKLTVTQLVKKLPAFAKPEGTLPCSQQATTVPIMR
jgi:hypothetical protein